MKKETFNGPYDKGKWVRFFVESDGTTVTLTQSDVEGAVISGNYVKLPANYRIVDTKIDVNNFAVPSAASVQPVVRQFTDETLGIAIPTKTNFDYVYLYAFVYKN